MENSEEIRVLLSKEVKTYCEYEESVRRFWRDKELCPCAEKYTKKDRLDCKHVNEFLNKNLGKRKVTINRLSDTFFMLKKIETNNGA